MHQISIIWAFLVINELISSMSTVLEMKSGYNVLCTFTYIVNRVVSGKIYTAGKKFYTAAGSDGIDKFHL